MNNFSPIAFGFLAGLICLAIWQVRILKNLSRSTSVNANLNDSKYYELKYQLQFVTSVFPLIIAILGYVGYSYLTNLPENIKKDIQAEIAPKLDSLKKANQQLFEEQSEIATKYVVLDNLYKTLEGKGGGINKQLSLSSAEVLSLSNQIDEVRSKTADIANKDIIRQPIFIVDPIYFNLNAINPRFEFKNLKTISGGKLPTFSKPPVLVPFSNRGSNVSVINVTNSAFELRFNFTSEYDTESIEFGLLIFEGN